MKHKYLLIAAFILLLAFIPTCGKDKASDEKFNEHEQQLQSWAGTSDWLDSAWRIMEE